MLLTGIGLAQQSERCYARPQALCSRAILLKLPIAVVGEHAKLARSETTLSLISYLLCQMSHMRALITQDFFHLTGGIA